MSSGAHSIRDVDRFLRAYAYPLLKSEGFRGTGRELSKVGPDGRIGFVAFRSYNMPHAPGFYCAYGVVTPAHMAWWEERSGPLSTAPLLGSALVMVQVDAPDPVRSSEVMGRPDWWQLHPGSDDEELGKRMGQALTVQAIPDLLSWFDAQAFAEDIARRREGVIPLMNPWPRAVAMALLDVPGSEDRLRQTLALLPSDDMVRVWIEARLGL